MRFSTQSNAVSTKFNLDILTKIAEMSPDPRELIRVLLLSNKKWSEALLNDTKFLKLYYRSREPLLLKVRASSEPLELNC